MSEYKKKREKIEEKIQKLTIEEKRSSLEAPFWNPNITLTKEQKESELMKRINKIYNEGRNNENVQRNQENISKNQTSNYFEVQGTNAGYIDDGRRRVRNVRDI